MVVVGDKKFQKVRPKVLMVVSTPFVAKEHATTKLSIVRFSYTKFVYGIIV